MRECCLCGRLHGKLGPVDGTWLCHGCSVLVGRCSCKPELIHDGLTGKNKWMAVRLRDLKFAERLIEYVEKCI